MIPNILSMFENSVLRYVSAFPEASDNLGHRELSPGRGVFDSHGAGTLIDPVNLFLVQIVIIIGICRVLAIFGSYFGQPSVIFEIVGGILIGPSAISKNSKFHEYIFPTHSLEYLNLVSNFGLLLYLFVIGLELDIDRLKTHAKKAGAVAIMGMAIPFCLGIAISQVLFDTLQGDDPAFADVEFTSFFVFIGTAMSITAFPVLARILKEGGLIYSRAGALTLGAAALNDAVAWCLLILAISLASAANLNTAGYVFATVFGIALFLLVLVRPLFQKFVVYLESLNSKVVRINLFVFTLLIVFIAAWTTALLGLDVIFGAFLFGLAVPRDTQLFKDCNEYIEQFVLTLTLPIYFALSGIRTDVTEIDTAAQGGMIVLVCVVASVGKYLGAGVTAYVSGVTFREAAAVAALMNTRGLVELIVLNLGLSAGILSTKTFSVMVIMCLFTTFITVPTIQYIYPEHLRIVEEESTVKALLEKPSKNDELEYHGIDGTVTNEVHIVETSRESRIAVIIDKLEFIQPIMAVLVLYEPTKALSKLNLTFMKFEEPTGTVRDTFVGLQNDRLIEVIEESTDIMSVVNPDITKPLPQLLPLSMFSKAIGAEVQTFNVRGDPAEFPAEIKTLVEMKKSNLIILPWRKSQYLERLVWGTLRKNSSPIALLVQTSTIEPGRASPRASVSGVGRDSNLRSGSIRGSIRMVTPDSPRIRQVLAIITGSFADISMICTLMRFLESSVEKMTVMVCGDKNSFPEAVQVAISVFRSESLAKGESVSWIKHFSISGNNVDALYREATKQPYDIILHSFLDPETAINEPATPRGGDASANTVKRSSLSQIAYSLVPPETVTSEYRRAIGVPEAAINSGLSYPELGSLGNRLLEDNVASYLMVFHEPILNARRRATTQYKILDIEQGGTSIDLSHSLEITDADSKTAFVSA